METINQVIDMIDHIFISEQAIFLVLACSLGLVAVLLFATIFLVFLTRLRNNRIDKQIGQYMPQFEKLVNMDPEDERFVSNIKKTLTPDKFHIFERFLRDKTSDIGDIEVAHYRRIAHESGFTEKLRQTAKRKRGWKRAIALRTLSYLRDTADIQLYRRVIKRDSFYPGLYAAAIGAGLCKDTDSIELILDRLGKGKSDNRDEILAVLEAFGPVICPQVTRYLAQRSMSEPMGTILLDFLRTQKYTGARETVERIITNPSSLDIRIHAVEALGLVGDQSSVQLLRTMDKDPDFRVRLKAIISIAQLEKEESIPMLLSSMEDPDWWVRRNAAELLYALPPKGRTELEKIGQNPDTDEGRTAQMILAEKRYGRERWRYKFAESFY